MTERNSFSGESQENVTLGVKTEFYSGGLWKQYYSGFSVTMAVFAVGAAWSWTATALPDIKSSGDLGTLSVAEESWITSVVFFCAIFGSGFSGFTMQRFGPRTSMLIQTVPLVGGWVTMATAQSVLMLFLGRCVTGFCSGGICLAVPVFIAETTESHIRGKIGFGYELSGTAGILYIFIVGSYVSWRWQAAACAIIPVLFCILMFMVPDSPRSLVERGRLSDASKALAWFRCAKSVDLVDQEMNQIIQSVILEKSRKASQPADQWKNYFKPTVLRPILIGTCLMFFFQMCGASPVLAYTADIFQAAGSDDIYLATVLVGLAQVLVNIVAAVLVDRFGRRILLILSAVFMAISLIALGVFFYFKSEGQLPSGWNWVPLTCLIFFISAQSVGFGPIPWLVMGEIVAPAAKGFSSAVITIVNRILGFLVVFFFKYIISAIGQHGCYWLFGVFCVIGAFYVYFCVPETKGKTLEEIQEHFLNISKGKDLDSDLKNVNDQIHPVLYLQTSRL